MKKSKEKIVSILLIALSIISIGISAYAHSGRTDSSGGHKDNKNKSGLGSYHYHCGGHSAHLHTNGVCPYSSSSSSKKSSTTSSSAKKTTTTKTTTVPATTEPVNVDVTEIKINENIENLELGESKVLTATITPSNATDKNITWKSSDENIATISSEGEIIAKNSGTVDITATTSNGKTNTIKINIKEEEKIDNNSTTIEISASIENNTTNNSITNTKEDSSPIGAVIVLLGLLGGAVF